jgi:hypothetical protein
MFTYLPPSLHTALWRTWASSKTKLTYPEWVDNMVGIIYHRSDDTYQFKDSLHHASILLEWGDYEFPQELSTLFEFSDGHPEYYTKDFES